MCVFRFFIQVLNTAPMQDTLLSVLMPTTYWLSAARSHTDALRDRDKAQPDYGGQLIFPPHQGAALISGWADRSWSALCER